MAAIDAEPVPAPVIAAGSALRAGAVGGVLAAIRDSFRVAFGGGFPLAARAQALALVLVVVVAAGGTGIVAARRGRAARRSGDPAALAVAHASGPVDRAGAQPVPVDPAVDPAVAHAVRSRPGRPSRRALGDAGAVRDPGGHGRPRRRVGERLGRRGAVRREQRPRRRR